MNKVPVRNWKWNWNKNYAIAHCKNWCTIAPDYSTCKFEIRPNPTCWCDSGLADRRDLSHDSFFQSTTKTNENTKLLQLHLLNPMPSLYPRARLLYHFQWSINQNYKSQFSYFPHFYHIYGILSDTVYISYLFHKFKIGIARNCGLKQYRNPERIFALKFDQNCANQKIIKYIETQKSKFIVTLS